MALKDLLRRLLPSHRPSDGEKPTPTDWSIAKATNHETGAVGILRIRTSKPRRDDISELTTAVVIRWPYESENGMPPSDVNQQQLAFEAALDPLSGENEISELVQVFTGMGTKEWTYYARNRERFMSHLNQLLAGHPRYPLEIEFYDDPAWEMWDEFRQSIQR